MTFPETRLTLIQRIAKEGSEADWRRFFDDYWRPVFRFSARWGHLTVEDAEDVTSCTFEVLLRAKLLSRWVSDRRARLRTLLCTVVRNLIANRERQQAGRERLLRDNGVFLHHFASQLDAIQNVSEPETHNAFYAAWAEELLENAMEQLLGEFHREGKGDHFRVLHGRICEGLRVPEIALSLNLPVASVDNHYRRAKQRLRELLERQVREHVERYSEPKDVSAEFQREWQDLGEFLVAHGGIEVVLQRARAEFNPVMMQRRQCHSLAALMAQQRF